MKSIKYKIVITIFCISSYFTNAQQLQQKDTLKENTKTENIKFNYKQLIIPAALITYGAIGLNNGSLKKLDNSIRNEVLENNYKKLPIDDYIQYVPAISVYALNNLGVPGKNNLKDRTVILSSSLLIVFTSVTSLKYLTKIERPDGSNKSFPSGHTALAFAGAEFLYQEYKDQSIWIGLSGYAIASTTGVFRIYNNKHWLTDVVAGAGIGILSTKIAYWINPYLNNHIFKSNKNIKSAMVAPFYNGNQMGIGMIINLK